MAAAGAAASANAAALCASKAAGCATKAVSGRMRAEETVLALGLNDLSCPTDKKKVVSFMEAAGVAAEVALVVAAVATASSNEARAVA